MKQMNSSTKMIIAVTLAAVAIVIAVLLILSLTARAQPTKQDFTALDSERKVLDTSMNLYIPLITDFSNDLTTVFTEDRGSAETDAVKLEYTERFEGEREVNAKRLEQMASSPAARNGDVKKALESFTQRYREVVQYYDQEKTDMINITSSVAGPCAKVNNRDFGSSTAASDYTKAADACLAALAVAKKTSDEPAKKLLTEVEKLFKDRRDKFNEVTKSEGLDQNIARIYAIISLLDVNTDVAAITADYEATVKKDYTKLVEQANTSNKELETALSAAMKGEA